MTIDGAWKYIKDKYSNVLESVPMESFRGRNIAIDASGALFKLRATAKTEVVYKKRVLSEVVEESEIDIIWVVKVYEWIKKFLAYGITPVMVYDGDSKEAKEKTLKKRMEDRDKVLSKLEAVMDFEILGEIGENMSIAEIQKRFAVMGGDKDLIIEKEAEVRKLLCQLVHIPKSSMDFIKHFFSQAGIPTYQADGDGEIMCASLCITGRVAAVFSSDSDNIALGTPIIIRDMAPPRLINGKSVPCFEIIRIDNFLDYIGMDQETLRDVCILAGCDYNSKIKGISFNKAFGIIKNAGSIGNMDKKKYDISVLKYKECRKIFSNLSEEKIKSSGFLDFNIVESEELGYPIYEHFASYGFDSKYAEFISIVSKVPKSKPFRHPKYDRSNIIDDVILSVLEDDEYDELDNIIVLGVSVKKKSYRRKK